MDEQSPGRALVRLASNVLLDWYMDLSRVLGLVRYPERRLEAHDCVLIVLDPLETYRYTLAGRLDSLRSLVASARDARVPVVFTRWVRTRGALRDIVDEKANWTEFVQTTREPLIEKLLDPDKDSLLNVVYSDAFAESPRAFSEHNRNIDALHTFLEGRRATTLVIAGTWAEACIERTAYSAMTRGYRPVVVSPAIGGHCVRTTLANMDRIYADVVSDVHFVRSEPDDANLENVD